MHLVNYLPFCHIWISLYVIYNIVCFISQVYCFIIILYFCLYISGADNVHLKILVPSIAAGAIIGKGGETIAAVQKEAGARVKMSKANDFYPGKVLTTFRKTIR